MSVGTFYGEYLENERYFLQRILQWDPAQYILLWGSPETGFQTLCFLNDTNFWYDRNVYVIYHLMSIPYSHFYLVLTNVFHWVVLVLTRRRVI